MNRTERLYRIDTLLRTNRCVSMQHLLDELGVSIATVKRDLEYLRASLNAPIEWDRAGRGYRLTTSNLAGPRYELPGVWFNASEIHALLTIEHLLKEIEPGVLAPHFAALRDRLAGLLDDADADIQTIERRIFIRHRFKRAVSPRHFEKVVDALFRRHRLRIVHASRFTNETTARTISPQRLIHYREIWYLVAWCHLREAVRTFALDNLTEAEALDETAREMEVTELDILLNSGYGIWSGRDVRWAMLRFHPSSANWAASETWHHDQRARFDADGGYVLEIPYAWEDELVMDILKYGGGCTVLAPESLRATVMRRLGEALQNYPVESPSNDSLSR